MARFGRALRMNHPGDFSRVFRQGKRIGGGGLTVLSVENSVGHPRLGLAIAKKHVKLACHRNRLKRIIRESFRQHQSALSNIDIVVLSRPGVHSRDSAQIRATLEQHWLTVIAQWPKS